MVADRFGRWFDLEEALLEDCGISPHYRRPGGIVPALSDEELARLEATLAGLARAAGSAGYEYEILDSFGVRELLRPAARKSSEAPTLPTTGTPTR